MYNILIVDDERIERDGIKFLIEKYSLELNVFEAENGESALECIKSNHIDILFTDIILPFINGLDLIEDALLCNSDLKTIIYSGHSNFEFAKKAVSLRAISYILKPIDVNEFLNEVNRVIALCDNDRAKKKQEVDFLSTLKKSALYEKNKLLTSIILGANLNDLNDIIDTSIDINFIYRYTRMVLIEFKEKFFETNNNAIQSVLTNTLLCKYDYVNLNQYQSLIFLVDYKEECIEALEQMGNTISNAIMDNFNISVSLVFSKYISSPDSIFAEYEVMERLLEYKFFIKDVSILISDKNYWESSQTENTDDMLNNIYGCIEKDDLIGTEKGIRLLVDCLINSNKNSIIYTKFIFSEILKKICERNKKEINYFFIQNLEKIHTSFDITEIGDILISLLDTIRGSASSASIMPSNRAVEIVIKTIHEKYSEDLTLDNLAESVYFTPSYLSYLFKKETGQNILKYITTYRLEKAGQLLKTTNMKINDISSSIGYSSFSYFCMNFRNYFGLSPSKYRNCD